MCTDGHLPTPPLGRWSPLDSTEAEKCRNGSEAWPWLDKHTGGACSSHPQRRRRGGSRELQERRSALSQAFPEEGGPKGPPQPQAFLPAPKGASGEGGGAPQERASSTAPPPPPPQWPAKRGHCWGEGGGKARGQLLDKGAGASSPSRRPRCCMVLAQRRAALGSGQPGRVRNPGGQKREARRPPYSR